MDILKDIKVIDFTRAFAGPYCTQMLAELGADVIKIEQPGRGDETREWEPQVNGYSGYFMSLNRSKRSMTLNLKHEQALNIVYKLVERCDVVIENFATGVVERLGISYEDLKKVNPRLVYLSISAYGRQGPNKELRGYDPMIQADVGAMSINGNKGGPPAKIPIPVADITAGMFGAYAVAGCLYKRSVTEEGEYIDVPLFDSVAALQGIFFAEYFYKGKVVEPMGSEHIHRVPSKNYMTGDGTYIHLVANEGQWERLCRNVGLDEKFLHPPYHHNSGRLMHREEVDSAIERALAAKSGREWIALLQAAGVPCAPVNKLDQVAASEQAKSRNIILEWEQEGLGTAKGINYPYRFMNYETTVRRPVPRLGEHTEEIMREYGFTQEQIAVFKEKNVI